MRVGAQLYTLRTFLQTEVDIRRSLKQVAEMGYDSVQLSGLGPIDAATIKAICDEHRLDIVLTHNPAERILNDTEQLIEEHKLYNCQYLGLGALPEKYRHADWLPNFAIDYQVAVQKIHDAGMKFMYHNHHFEFQKINNDNTLMDAILDSFDADLMGVTLDTYWLQAAGCDVLMWLERMKDRIDCVHLKDMKIVGHEQRFAAVGEGNMNFPAILERLAELGQTKYLLVEQDTVDGSPFAALEASRQYLERLGF